MLKSLYEAIRSDATPKEITLCGRTYTTGEVYSVENPTPVALEVSTLTALVDYLKSNVDVHDIAQLICHVESPTRVSIRSRLEGGFLVRLTFISATARTRRMEFNAFKDSETFNIWIQSCFVDTPITADGGELKPTDKGLVLAYVGNVKSELVQGTSDDGVSQEVTVKSGIASVKKVVLPNPVTLRPYRTFNEV